MKRYNAWAADMDARMRQQRKAIARRSEELLESLARQEAEVGAMATWLIIRIRYTFFVKLAEE